LRRTGSLQAGIRYYVRDLICNVIGYLRYAAICVKW